jgi:hypothetical protein
LEGFKRKIKDIKHDLLLNEYLQEFVDSIMKPRRSNHPSDTIHHGTVTFPYVMGISDALGTTSMLEPFSKLNIHCVPLTKTGPVGDA